MIRYIELGKPVEKTCRTHPYRSSHEQVLWPDSRAKPIRGLSKRREATLSFFLHLNNCPVFWIDWVKGGKSVLAPYVTSVSEINNDFIKRYLAGVQDHQSDRSFYRIDNGEKVKLPNPHRHDLTNREFHNIIGKAGMTSPQFRRERERTSVWRKAVPRSPVLPPRFSSKSGAGRR